MSDVSYALFGAEITTVSGKTLRVSASGASALGFTFRLSVSDAALLDMPPQGIQVHFERETLLLSDYSLTREESERYFISFRLESGDAAFRSRMQALTAEIMRYTELKMSGSDAALSKAYVRYPAEAERDFAPDFLIWRKEALKTHPAFDALLCVPEWVLPVYSPSAVRAFLRLGTAACWQEYLAAAGLSDTVLAQRTPESVQLGAPYCARLLPDTVTLERLLSRCRESGTQARFIFPPMQEKDTDLFATLLHTLYGRVRQVTVQDAGMARLIKESFPGRFTVSAGPLLLKRRRDARMKWWPGDPKALKETSANGTDFTDWLQSLKITGYEWETVGYPIRMPKGSTLRLPFFQMNTGDNCPLSAQIHTGRRGANAPENCGLVCEHACFLYGKALNMVGRGNTLYGLDTRAVTEEDYLRMLLSENVESIILDLL